MNVVLIGMPGAGKSTLGVLLAKLMGYSFVDTDILMQQKYGALLGQILKKNGNSAFLKLDEETMLGLETDNTVIATGGSAIYSKAGMEHLRQNAVCVYIEVPYRLLAMRLGDLKSAAWCCRKVLRWKICTTSVCRCIRALQIYRLLLISRAHLMWLHVSCRTIYWLMMTKSSVRVIDRKSVSISSLFIILNFDQNKFPFKLHL